MWQNLKLLAFLLCLWPFIAVTGRLMTAPITHESTRHMSAAELKASLHQTNSSSGSLIPIILSFAASILFLADAVRREYDGPSAWPIAIAVMGVLTIGLTSALYYVLWGWRPTREAGGRSATFCQPCCQQTVETKPFSLITHNGMGFRLIGAALRCDTCGSRVKTCWFVFLIPLLPLGSYRFLPIGDAGLTESRFMARKLPGMYWPQIWPHLLLIVTGVALLTYFAKH